MLRWGLVLLFLISLTGCWFPVPAPQVPLPPDNQKPLEPGDPPTDTAPPEEPPDPLAEIIGDMGEKYGSLTPREWGERVTGVITRIDSRDKIIALTFDACGATGLSTGFDRELADFLIREEIAATLFLSGQWLQANWEISQELAQVPFFAIENHGYRHLPLSVSGRSIYGIQGTANVAEVVEEIWRNDQLILELTGQKPRYFRSGTAYYDEVAVQIAREMGKEVISFNVLGDAGATFSKAQIERALLGAKPGFIILYHINRPESDIAEALVETLPKLKAQGFRFVLLRDYHQQLK